MSALLQLERESFERFCKIAGTTPAQAESTLLPGIREAVENTFRIIEKNADSGVGRQIRDYWQQALRADYLTLNRFLIETEKASYISDIVAAKDLPIDYRYLAGLAPNLRVAAPTPRNPESLEAFLSAVPTVNLYEPAFNAFVTGKTTIQGTPAVCVYSHLYGSLRGLIDIVAPLVLVGGGVATPGDVRRHADTRAFKRACIERIEAIAFQRLDYDDADVESLTESSDDGPMYLELMAGGGWSFVWLHEYGHLLMGHLVRRPSPDLEKEADAFATKAVHGKFASLHPNVFGWVSVGVAFTLLAFHMIETTHKLKPSTHPPALERLKAFIGRDVFLNLVTDSILEACAPAIREGWRVHILAPGL